MLAVKVIIVLLGCLLIAAIVKLVSMILQDLANQRQFEVFIERFNKPYKRQSIAWMAVNGREGDGGDGGDDDDQDKSIEFYRRFRTFEDSFDQIEALNAQRSHDSAAIYGLTQFADMTRDEFTANMLTKRKMMRVARPKAVQFGALLPETTLTKKFGLNRTARSLINIQGQQSPDLAADGLPISFNWLDEGRLSAVRNQGSCGACWAHSVIETIESMAAIEHNDTSGAPVRRLSVQQMIDCAAGTNHGCAGGDTCNLLQWLVLNDVPIATERSYPPMAPVGAGPFGSGPTGPPAKQPCSVERVRDRAAGDPPPVRVRAFTCENLVGREERMVEYLALVGPLTVAVNAAGWQFYLDGVIQHHCEGGGALLNHAVQVVGYDRSGELPYWIVRNSWGVGFGVGGFVRIGMGGNVCGIATQVSAVSVM